MRKRVSHAPGTRLYPLIYLACLTLVAVSASALAILGRDHVIDATVQVAATDDAALVRGFVESNLTTNDLADGLATRRAELEPLLADLARRHGFLDISVFSPERGIVLGTGEAPPPSQTALAAKTGTTAADVVNDGVSSPRLVEAIPIVEGSAVWLVFQIRRDAAQILGAAGETLRDVVLVTLTAAVVLAALLYAIFRAANTRLRRQQEQLLESRRRDPLTGLLNHGAAITALTDLAEAARIDASSIGIALVDVDNFRLLNDVHGSEAGDRALLTIAGAFRPDVEGWTVLARYGPDEFMAIAPPTVARELPAAIQRVRDRLEASHLDLPNSERLPLTVSAGIAYFPFHAGSVIELVSAASTALGGAKASGGNSVEIADAWTSEPEAPHTTFDVLQGLILAIDRKDRYTKLHSEDVAAYALFLGRQLGLSDEELASLRVAGLLHDVGKIGIPDDILRKPGRLTPYEMEIVKQHVALGDLIVREVADIERVREGVRYHHERWDGNGYMVGLAGENIPSIARILAVADAFSAMTTSRPYRKALSTEQAIDELRSVAGTQLDARLVDVFVSGLAADPDAPLPGALRNPSALWTPSRRAA